MLNWDDPTDIAETLQPVTRPATQPAVPATNEVSEPPAPAYQPAGAETEAPAMQAPMIENAEPQTVAVEPVRAEDKRVILETPLGGERFLEELEDDPLPRIC